MVGPLQLLLLGVTAFVLGLQMIHWKSFFSRIADMLEVVRLGAGYAAAIQNLSKSDFQLMQPQTPTYLTTLNSKHLKTPLPG